MAGDYNVAKNSVAKNGFVTYPDGKLVVANVWPGRCNFPDFTKPATRNWWAENVKSLAAGGVVDLWNGMNEPASRGQILSNTIEFDFDGNKTTIKQAHNVYGMQMTKSTYDGAK